MLFYQYILYIFLITNSIAYHIEPLISRRDFFQSSTFALSSLLIPFEKPICIIGASSKTGRECIKLLEQQKRKVKAVSRHNFNIQDKSKIIPYLYNLKNFSGIDDIIAGSSSVIYLANIKPFLYKNINDIVVNNIVSSCIKNNINRFIYISSSYNCRDKFQLRCVNTCIKRNGEEIIKNLYKKAVYNGKKNINYTIIRVGHLTNQESKNIEISIQPKAPFYISRKDLASLCINTINIPSAAGKTIYAHNKQYRNSFGGKLFMY